MFRWLIVFLLIASGAALASERSTPDLGAVKGVIQHKEGRRSFDEQIAGKTLPDVLGSVLPAGLTREAIISLLAPKVDPSRITLVGAKPWAHSQYNYVAIICVAHDAADIPAKNAAPACEDHPDVFLGVLSLSPGSRDPRLIARTPPGFALTSDWNAPALLPSVTPVGVGDDTSEWPPGRSDDEVTNFDMAPYQITPRAFAFGLRSAQNEGYSGGYGVFETLHLFVIDGATLRRILVQPIYAMQMIAGDWRKDGARSHQVNEAKLVIGVAGSMTAGHYDLTIQELGVPGVTTLRWNAAKAAYAAAQG